jgi:hypothetical protein
MSSTRLSETLILIISARQSNANDGQIELRIGSG